MSNQNTDTWMVILLLVFFFVGLPIYLIFSKAADYKLCKMRFPDASTWVCFMGDARNGAR